MEVQVGLRGQEVVQVILPPPAVPFPGRAAEHGNPIRGRRAIGLRIGPDIPIRLGIAAILAAFDEGRVLIQSPAIIEWLEERHPEPALLPSSPEARARVRALAAIVGCDIHPINNRRILEYLRNQLHCDEAAINAWCATWISAGFDALEALLAADTTRGNYCFGQTPSIADVYLIPQVESARRFKVDMARWPLISAVDAACHKLDAFRMAVPTAQPDAA